MCEIFNTTRQYINLKRYTKTIRAEAAAVKAQVTQALWFLAKRRAKWFYNLVARASQCVNRVWVLASCKLAALIFTCIYLMVSAMTSYSSLTSRRIFVSRQHSTESDYDQSIHEELSFHRLQNNVYYRWISSHFSCKQNSKHKNAELSILAGEDLTPKNPLERERRLEIQRRKQQRWRRHQQTAEQREHDSMNFEC